MFIESTTRPARRLQWHGLAFAAMLVAFCPLPSAATATAMRTRLPETETEKKFFDAIKTNQLQLAVSTILRAPDGKQLRIAELADEHGMTALHWTVANRNAAGVRWLLDKGADLELQDDQGRTPLKIALDNGDTRAMTMLIDRGARTSTALPGHDEELKALTKTSDIVDFMLMTLGLAYYEGKGVAKNQAKSAEVFAIGCEAGSARACHNLGTQNSRGEGVPKDAAKAVTLYQKACDGQYAASCGVLGSFYYFGKDLPKDWAKAAALLERACIGDSAPSCHMLSEIYGAGDGVAPDKTKAATLLAKACKLGYQESCDRQAAKPPAAPAATADESPAALQTRCDAKDWTACNDLGSRYQKGQGVKTDLGRAAALYGKACDGGHGSACHALANLYSDGQGVAKDAAKSEALLARACKLGDLHVCPTPAAAAPSTAAPAPAAKAATGFVVLRVRLGSDTVASVERDIKARGGSPNSGGTGGQGKFNLSAMSGDYSDGGPGVMSVSYDFDATGPAGRLIAVTISRKVDFGAPYAKLAADRKAALAKVFGSLKSKSATEHSGSTAGCTLTLHENPDGGWFYEIYRLPN